ncbi:ATP-binding cassette domain-containing protein [Gordonia sp. JH63]|uniref:ABC transporter ATP-binding protein n=1 Tax=Gordonia hongkongensis TaxID=1701090 RepID=A0ABT6BU85_9ACTN|nr:MULTISPECIES: ABC transporter ATP-binding protein [Gordonia]MBR7193679.1 ABC transporter ATP-binding protein [Gordonia sp. SCSIO 19800]MDF6101305.1 ABC transporter ATP-binding protein [Gordonia hongkongensis]MDT0221080.1 ABC transporter ATP-binding protein [Gordonia sp. AC31]QHD87486.1 ATP-binding cassette domain-containing protein [Gordonia sp. JH63]WGJ85214.1 ABC transporter ATP-binding protein [Gordonia sp. SMJS1]
MRNAVRVDDVSVVYGSTTVLDGVSFHVPAGSITAVIGPSGCGKTTLLRAIAGLEPIRAGRIEIDGVEVASAGSARTRPVGVRPERRRFGLVPQEGALFDNLTVAGNVGFGLGPWWRRMPGRAARIAELLDVVGLEEFGDRRPDSLSGGQRQRVALARALAPRPAVIGLDEPFSALDAQLRTQLREHVRATILAEGSSGLLVTHDREEAMAMADHVVVLMAGCVRQVGTPEEIYLEPVDAEVARMFGEMTDLPGEADDGEVSCAAGRLRIRRPGHGAGVVMLRPGDLEIVSGVANVGCAEVLAVRPRGDHVDVRVSVPPVESGCPAVELTVRAEPGWHRPAGTVVEYRQRRPVHFRERH